MSAEIKYLDFELTIEKSAKDKYVMRAEFGDEKVEATFVNPFNKDKREIINSTLTAAALRRTARTRATTAPEVAKMKDFGGTLFENVIAGSVDEFLTRCRAKAAKERKGIRWRLALDPSLEELPWEFLCYRDRFLAVDPRNPIVRYIKPDTWIAPLEAAHPLRLLVVIASPKDEVPLDTEAEKDRILGALKPLVEKGQLQISIIEGPDTLERIFDTLLPDQTHILHFIGHGTFDDKRCEGVLIMEDSGGNAHRINSERLSVLMQGKLTLRLIVLNSCLGSVGESVQPFSSVAAGMVRSGIPAVIAMQFEISDDAAREIAETFYTALALNRPVDAALTEARRKIYVTQEDSLEWATPILYMQVPDGQLFEFKAASPGTHVPALVPAPPPTPSPGWRERWNQVGDWIKEKAGKDSSAQSVDVFDKGREIWYTMIGSKTAASPAQPKTPVAAPQPSPNIGVPPSPNAAQVPSPPPSTRPPSPPSKTEPPPPSTQPQESQLQRSQPQPGSATTPTTAVSHRPESRIYQTPLVPTFLADTIRQYLVSQSCESQVLQRGTVCVTQGKKKTATESADASLAATIVIERSGARLRVSIGGGRWIEQGSPVELGADAAATLITGSIAMEQQQSLLSIFWDIIETRVARSNGCRIA